MSRRASRAGALTGALVLVGASALPAGASHSVPAPYPYFWDANQNGIPSGEPELDPEGPGWTNALLNRLDEAVGEWSSETEYDPTVGASGHNIFVDGRPSNCDPDWRSGANNDQLVIGRSCPVYVVGVNPLGFHTYERMTDVDVYFNIGTADNVPWHFGAGYPDTNKWHFKGILTHELGHTLRLTHTPEPCVLSQTGLITMCPGISPDDRAKSYWFQSLHPDDIEGANSVY